MSQVKFEIFSDGGSFNNGFKRPDLPQLCSMGIVLTLNEKIIFSGSKGFEGEHATISFAELNGAITALKLLERKIKSLKTEIKKPYKVDLYSDSQFVIKGATEWINGWVVRNWTNAAGATVGQVDLWKELYFDYIKSKDWDINFIHIKGHTNKDDFYSRMNSECDRLAVNKIKQMKIEKGL